MVTDTPALARTTVPPPAPPAPEGAAGAATRMRTLKVLHIITGLRRGGAETQLVRLVTQLDRRRVASVVVSLADEGALGAELRQAGVALHTLGMRRDRLSPSAVLALLRLVRHERPDAIQSWLYHADLMALAAARIGLRVPLLWNLRCSDMELARFAPRTAQLRRVLALLSRLPDAVVVNSEAGRRFHADLGYRPRRWEVVPNGIDTARFRPDAAARARRRAALGVDAAQPLIGMVARVDPMKDHATGLAAMAALAEARPDARFVLVGRGTEALVPPAGLAGRLTALGESGEVAAILPALDLLLLSSAFGEGFPNVIGEAMACGVPCIATDVGDAAAIIGDTGTVVPPRDAAAIAAAMLAFLEQPHEARARAGEAARRRILERYTLDAMAARYARLYDALVPGGA